MTSEPSVHGQAPIAPGLTGPFVISTIDLPTSGTLGLTHCPGRNRVDGAGRRWRRSLTDDLTSISQWRADGVISLVEAHELAALGVPDLAEALATNGVPWFHLPIEDMHSPGAPFAEAWQANGAALLDVLNSDGRLIIHCAAGLGRTGMIAAKMLVANGMAPHDAIVLVRERRPGTIETTMQSDYVLNGPLLGSH